MPSSSKDEEAPILLSHHVNISCSDAKHKADRDDPCQAEIKKSFSKDARSQSEGSSLGIELAAADVIGPSPQVSRNCDAKRGTNDMNATGGLASPKYVVPSRINPSKIAEV